MAALLMAVTPPLVSAAFPGVQLKSSARRTAAALRLARESAIRSGKDLALVVDVQGRRLDLPGYRPISLPRGLDLKLESASREQIDENRGAIRFYPDGSSTGGRVLLSLGEGPARHGWQVGVTWLTGRVRLAPLGKE